MDFRKELTDNILPFWLKGVDRKNGGIFTQLDRAGNIYGREKSVWFQGRALWTFSKAYNVIDKKREYLEASEIIFSFLDKCTDSDGRMYFTVTEDGRGLQKRRYYFSETFAAIGAMEFYKATGREDAFLTAEKYFDVAYECYTGKRKNPPKINPENLQMKALSPVMIMLSTASVMRSGGRNTEKYARIAAECANEIIHGGFLTEHALLESVSSDGAFCNTPSGRVVNPGHSLECAWFLMQEAELSNNSELLEGARKIIDITLKLGVDEKHGGIISFTDILGYPPMALEWDMKLWWPQCEAMIALRLAADIFGNREYMAKYQELLNYTEKYFADREMGEWYGYLHYDNTPSTTLKGNIFKGPFHIPRFYMIMALLDSGKSIADF
ncbi:MAG: AGE family epimerase/isomerase [Clostridia bacterium]|nr:AGE family epimerase/isomerase [Clostridia bacterium]